MRGTVARRLYKEALGRKKIEGRPARHIYDELKSEYKSRPSKAKPPKMSRRQMRLHKIQSL